MRTRQRSGRRKGKGKNLFYSVVPTMASCQREPCCTGESLGGLVLRLDPPPFPTSRHHESLSRRLASLALLWARGKEKQDESQALASALGRLWVHVVGSRPLPSSSSSPTTVTNPSLSAPILGIRSARTTPSFANPTLQLLQLEEGSQISAATRSPSTTVPPSFWRPLPGYLAPGTLRIHASIHESNATRPLRHHLANGMGRHQLVAADSRGKIVYAEGREVVLASIIGLMADRGGEGGKGAGRGGLCILSRSTLPWPPVGLSFHPLRALRVLVWGVYGCQVLQFDREGKMLPRFSIDLNLGDTMEASGLVRAAHWLLPPGKEQMAGGRFDDRRELFVCVVLEFAIKVYRISMRGASGALTHCYRTMPDDRFIFDAVAFAQPENGEGDNREWGKRRLQSSFGMNILVMTKGLQLLRLPRVATGGVFLGTLDPSTVTPLPLPVHISLEQLPSEHMLVTLHYSQRLGLLLVGRCDQILAFPVDEGFSRVQEGFILLSPSLIKNARARASGVRRGPHSFNARTRPISSLSSSGSTSSLPLQASHGPYLRIFEGPTKGSHPCVFVVTRDVLQQTEGMVVLSYRDVEGREMKEGVGERGTWCIQDLELDYRDKDSFGGSESNTVSSLAASGTSSHGGDESQTIAGFTIAMGPKDTPVAIILHGNGALSLHSLIGTGAGLHGLGKRAFASSPIVSVSSLRSPGISASPTYGEDALHLSIQAIRFLLDDVETDLTTSSRWWSSHNNEMSPSIQSQPTPITTFPYLKFDGLSTRLHGAFCLVFFGEHVNKFDSSGISLIRASCASTKGEKYGRRTSLTITHRDEEEEEEEEEDDEEDEEDEEEDQGGMAVDDGNPGIRSAHVTLPPPPVGSAEEKDGREGGERCLSLGVRSEFLKTYAVTHVRVLVGLTGSATMPRLIQVLGQRRLTVVPQYRSTECGVEKNDTEDREGMPEGHSLARWYDFMLTEEEMLLVLRSRMVTLSLLGVQEGKLSEEKTNARGPVLDAVELYGRCLEELDIGERRTKDARSYEPLQRSPPSTCEKGLFSTSRGIQTSREEWRMRSEPSTAPWELTLSGILRVLMVKASMCSSIKGCNAVPMDEEEELEAQEGRLEYAKLCARRAGRQAAQVALGITWGTSSKRRHHHAVRGMAKDFLRRLCGLSPSHTIGKSHEPTTEVAEKDMQYHGLKDATHLSRVRILLDSPFLPSCELSAILYLLRSILTKRPHNLYIGRKSWDETGAKDQGGDGERKDAGRGRLWTISLVKHVQRIIKTERDQCKEDDIREQRCTLAREVIAFGLKEVAMNLKGTVSSAKPIPSPGSLPDTFALIPPCVEAKAVSRAVDSLIRFLDSSDAKVSNALGIGIAQLIRIHRGEDQMEGISSVPEGKQEGIRNVDASIPSSLRATESTLSRTGCGGAISHSSKTSSEDDSKIRGSLPSALSSRSTSIPILQYSCNHCAAYPLPAGRFHCTVCVDMDLCAACYSLNPENIGGHVSTHRMVFMPGQGESIGTHNSRKEKRPNVTIEDTFEEGPKEKDLIVRDNSSKNGIQSGQTQRSWEKRADREGGLKESSRSAEMEAVTGSDEAGKGKDGNDEISTSPPLSEVDSGIGMDRLLLLLFDRIMLRFSHVLHRVLCGRNEVFKSGKKERKDKTWKATWGGGEMQSMNQVVSTDEICMNYVKLLLTLLVPTTAISRSRLKNAEILRSNHGRRLATSLSFALGMALSKLIEETQQLLMAPSPASKISILLSRALAYLCKRFGNTDGVSVSVQDVVATAVGPKGKSKMERQICQLFSNWVLGRESSVTNVQQDLVNNKASAMKTTGVDGVGAPIEWDALWPYPKIAETMTWQHRENERFLVFFRVSDLNPFFFASLFDLLTAVGRLSTEKPPFLPSLIPAVACKASSENTNDLDWDPSWARWLCDLLCSASFLPSLSSLRKDTAKTAAPWATLKRSARGLLRVLCGPSPSAYRRTLDFYCFSQELGAWYHAIDTLRVESTRQVPYERGKVQSEWPVRLCNLPYSKQVEIHRSLSRLVKGAVTCPRHWQAFSCLDSFPFSYSASTNTNCDLKRGTEMNEGKEERTEGERGKIEEKPPLYVIFSLISKLSGGDEEELMALHLLELATEETLKKQMNGEEKGESEGEKGMTLSPTRRIAKDEMDDKSKKACDEEEEEEEEGNWRDGILSYKVTRSRVAAAASLRARPRTGSGNSSDSNNSVETKKSLLRRRRESRRQLEDRSGSEDELEDKDEEEECMEEEEKEEEDEDEGDTVLHHDCFEEIGEDDEDGDGERIKIRECAEEGNGRIGSDASDPDRDNDEFVIEEGTLVPKRLGLQFSLQALKSAALLKNMGLLTTHTMIDFAYRAVYSPFLRTREIAAVLFRRFWDELPLEEKATCVEQITQLLPSFLSRGSDAADLLQTICAILETERDKTKIRSVTEAFTRSSTYTPYFSASLPFFETLVLLLETQLRSIKNHPAAPIYEKLHVLNGHKPLPKYLDSTPCSSCVPKSSPSMSTGKTSYRLLPLESLKSVYRATENCLFLSLRSCYQVRRIQLNISDAHSRYVKTIRLYFLPRQQTSSAALAGVDRRKWEFLATLHLHKGQSSTQIDLPVAAVVGSLWIEYGEFHSSIITSAASLCGGEGTEMSVSVSCPSCGRALDAHRFCQSCGEIASCRSCRHVSYSQVESFLCEACGYCGYGNFRFRLLAVPATHTLGEGASEEDVEKIRDAYEQAAQSLAEEQLRLSQTTLPDVQVLLERETRLDTFPRKERRKEALGGRLFFLVDSARATMEGQDLISTTRADTLSALAVETAAAVDGSSTRSRRLSKDDKESTDSSIRGVSFAALPLSTPASHHSSETSALSAIHRRIALLQSSSPALSSAPPLLTAPSLPGLCSSSSSVPSILLSRSRSLVTAPASATSPSQSIQASAALKYYTTRAKAFHDKRALYARLVQQFEAELKRYEQRLEFGALGTNERGNLPDEGLCHCLECGVDMAISIEILVASVIEKHDETSMRSLWGWQPTTQQAQSLQQRVQRQQNPSLPSLVNLLMGVYDEESIHKPASLRKKTSILLKNLCVVAGKQLQDQLHYVVLQSISRLLPLLQHETSFLNPHLELIEELCWSSDVDIRPSLSLSPSPARRLNIDNLRLLPLILRHLSTLTFSSRQICEHVALPCLRLFGWLLFKEGGEPDENCVTFMLSLLDETLSVPPFLQRTKDGTGDKENRGWITLGQQRVRKAMSHLLFKWKARMASKASKCIDKHGGDRNQESNASASTLHTFTFTSSLQDFPSHEDWWLYLLVNPNSLPLRVEAGNIMLNLLEMVKRYFLRLQRQQQQRQFRPLSKPSTNNVTAERQVESTSDMSVDGEGYKEGCENEEGDSREKGGEGGIKTRASALPWISSGESPPFASHSPPFVLQIRLFELLMSYISRIFTGNGMTEAGWRNQHFKSFLPQRQADTSFLQLFSLLRHLVCLPPIAQYMAVRGGISWISILAQDELNRVLRNMRHTPHSSSSNQGVLFFQLIQILNAVLSYHPHIRRHCLRDQLVPLMRMDLQLASMTFLPPALTVALNDILQITTPAPDLRSKAEEEDAYIAAVVSLLVEEVEEMDTYSLTTASNPTLLRPSSGIPSPETSSKNQKHRKVCMLLRILKDSIAPPRTHTPYRIQFRRAPSQDDFFRGNLARNPVWAKDIEDFVSESNDDEAINAKDTSQIHGREEGPTVRDLRRWLARELGIVDSLELLECLVTGKILSLNLPLRLVYSGMWREWVMKKHPEMYGMDRGNEGGGSRGGAGVGGGEEVVQSEQERESELSDANLPPMVVTYRLMGVDGEPTEEVVETLEDEKAEDEKAAAAALSLKMIEVIGSVNGGLHALLTLVRPPISPSSSLKEREISSLAIKTLRLCCKAPENRSRLLLRLNGPATLLSYLLTALRMSRRGGGRGVGTTALLQLVEELGSGEDGSHAEMQNEERDRTQDSGTCTTLQGQEGQKTVKNSEDDTVRVLLDALEDTAILDVLRANPSLTKAVGRLLPFLTYGRIQACAVLTEKIVSEIGWVRWQGRAEDKNGRQKSGEKEKEEELGTAAASSLPLLVTIMLEALYGLTGCRQGGSAPTTIRDQLLERGFTAATLEALQSVLPIEDGIGRAVQESGSHGDFLKRKERVEGAWKVRLAAPVVLPALRVLAGLARGGHVGTWTLLLSSGALKMLHDIEELTGAGHAGSVAEEMLEDALSAGTIASRLNSPESLSSSPSVLQHVCEAIQDLRKKTKAQKRRLAQQNRCRTLSAMGLSITQGYASTLGPSIALPMREADAASQQEGNKAAAHIIIDDAGGNVTPSSSAVSSESSLLHLSGEAASSDSVSRHRRPRSLSLSALPSSTASFLPSSMSATKKAISKTLLSASTSSHSNWLKDLQGLPEEPGLACEVCQEGLALKPSEVLGVYIYSKGVGPCDVASLEGDIVMLSRDNSRSSGGSEASTGMTAAGPTSGTTAAVPASGSTLSTTALLRARTLFEPFGQEEMGEEGRGMEEGENGGRGRNFTWGRRHLLASASSSSPSSAGSRRSCRLVTTVSAFNLIHLSCHAEAARADRVLKQPKGEWEGASLRNSRVSANGLLPIRGPQTSPDAFSQAVDKHFARLKAFHQHAPVSRLGLVAHDVRFLLLRVSYGDSLRKDSGGGSLSSNLKLVPYQLAMAEYLKREEGNEEKCEGRKVYVLKEAVWAWLEKGKKMLHGLGEECAKTEVPQGEQVAEYASKVESGREELWRSSGVDVAATMRGTQRLSSPGQAKKRKRDGKLSLMDDLSELAAGSTSMPMFAVLFFSLEEWEAARPVFARLLLLSAHFCQGEGNLHSMSIQQAGGELNASRMGAGAFQSQTRGFQKHKDLGDGSRIQKRRRALSEGDMLDTNTRPMAWNEEGVDEDEDDEDEKEDKEDVHEREGKQLARVRGRPLLIYLTLLDLLVKGFKGRRQEREEGGRSEGDGLYEDDQQNTRVCEEIASKFEELTSEKENEGWLFRVLTGNISLGEVRGVRVIPGATRDKDGADEVIRLVRCGGSSLL
ncbi:Zinc finger, ZZ-type [Nannochloropsis gaditana]|uniref:Zinc finger, ZZ-type n=1 Tax=Nannochloropsis gaditana TaxID=72520 RepID=W7U2B9_9STRA|nr:Zinc finger, ZZ-type [Nannochloropsis gaditana]